MPSSATVGRHHVADRSLARSGSAGPARPKRPRSRPAQPERVLEGILVAGSSTSSSQIPAFRMSECDSGTQAMPWGDRPTEVRNKRFRSRRSRHHAIPNAIGARARRSCRFLSPLGAVSRASHAVSAWRQGNAPSMQALDFRRERPAEQDSEHYRNDHAARPPQRGDARENREDANREGGRRDRIRSRYERTSIASG